LSRSISDSAGAVGLVEARRVVEIRHAIKPERDVGAGPDEFGGVEQAGLQAGEHFSRETTAWNRSKVLNFHTYSI
jgi:hypothetical protein